MINQQNDEKRLYSVYIQYKSRHNCSKSRCDWSLNNYCFHLGAEIAPQFHQIMQWFWKKVHHQIF